MASGRVNQAFRLEHQGITNTGQVYYNLTPPALVEAALSRKEGRMGKGGTLLVTTGEFTGRSPKDKFIVRTPKTEDTIWWDNNQAMDPDAFERLHIDMLAHMTGRDFFVQDLTAGADPAHSINVRVINELAWHNLFIRYMLRRPARSELDSFVADYTIINCPSFKANPARHGCASETVIAVNIDKKLILIGNTEYAGENKKSVFGLMNYLMPEKGVMSMHCSANHAKDDTSDSAIFFGLSGTGKTTLSADPNRILLGDDEHCWTDDGIFNIEGGCYAKTINLSAESEPEIFDTCTMFGTVIENMVFNPETREVDYEDASLTENMRCAYPLDYIPNATETGLAGHPENVVMLTCDAFGVMPPIARLTPDQAMYHFLSGFTAKMPATERGLTEPQPVFSTCFGAPFMPRRPEVYGKLLREKVIANGATCWLVNSGWTGGSFGTGSRMPIKATRALLTAALDGSLNNVKFRKDPNFGFDVPVSVPGVADVLLDPRRTWDDPAAYDNQAAKLVAMFSENFQKFLPHVDDAVKEEAIG